MKRLLHQGYLSVLSIIGLGTIAFLSVIYFYEMKNINTTLAWVMHTHKTIEEAYTILVDTRFMEASARGYLLFGEQKYLDDYQQSATNLQQNLAQLKFLTRDNAEQSAELNELQKLFTTRFSGINHTIDIRKKYNTTDTLKYIKSDKDRLMKIRLISKKSTEIILNVINVEKNILKLRSITLINHLNSTAKIALIADIVSLSIILMCLVLLNRQLIKRLLTEKDLHQSQLELQKLAYFDTLTGLHNRISLLNYLKKAMNSKNPEYSNIALFYVDVDNFKNINDTYGHEVGDKLLKIISDRLKNIDYKNKFIARISGDEFAIVVNSKHQNNDVSAIAQATLELMTIPIIIENNQIVSTVSIGICIYNDNANDETSLLKNADIAMYKAKQNGKNNYQLCTKEMSSEFEERTILYNHLYRAVLNKEFVIMYQPKMSLRTGKPAGVEALIRWDRPGVGITYPSEFITLAEHNGMIVPIGEWVMYSACEQAKKWQALGIDISTIAINVSMREFMVGDFHLAIEKIIKKTGFNPNNLELEITETILMEQSPTNLNVLKDLKARGVKITIDDFGTGYSSLSYLNLFPIDKIKIDKSFIARIPAKKDAAIIRAIISMAHSLGIKVVAEGVENEAQLDFLRQHLCDEIQGYHYSHPLSSHEVHDFFKSHHSMKTNG